MMPKMSIILSSSMRKSKSTVAPAKPGKIKIAPSAKKLVRLVANLDEEDGWFDLEDWIEAVSVRIQETQSRPEKLDRKAQKLEGWSRLKRSARLTKPIRYQTLGPSTKIMAVQTSKSRERRGFICGGIIVSVGRRFVRVHLPFLHPMIPRRARGSLGFGKVACRSIQPLTPRVIVNQIWARLFGQGIVSTVDILERAANTHRIPNCSIGSPMNGGFGLEPQSDDSGDRLFGHLPAIGGCPRRSRCG